MDGTGFRIICNCKGYDLCYAESRTDLVYSPHVVRDLSYCLAVQGLARFSAISGCNDGQYRFVHVLPGSFLCSVSRLNTQVGDRCR